MHLIMMVMMMLLLMMMMMNDVHFDMPLLANFKKLQPFPDSDAEQRQGCTNLDFVTKDRKHGTYHGVWPVRRQKHRYLWCCSVSLLKWAKHRKMTPCGALRASPPSSTTVTTASI